MTQPVVSVIIPVRNAARWLGHQLEALAQQLVPVPWEVLVADNGSTDGTYELATSWAPCLSLRVIDASDRRGPNHARNRGAAEAHGDLLLYCDGDDVVQDGWVAAFWSAREEWDLAAGRLDARLVNDERTIAWHSGLKLDGVPSLVGWLPTVNGGNFAVHRSVYAAVGGLDENFVRGADDLEFGFRAQLAGFRLGYVPKAVVAYRLRRSLPAIARQQYSYGRSRAPLYRQYRSQGMRRQSWKHNTRSWLRVAACAPELRDRVGRGRWVVQASFMTGMAVGSLVTRTAYFSE